MKELQGYSPFGLEVLKVTLSLLLFLNVSYISLVIGTSAISLLTKLAGMRRGNSLQMRLAADLVSLGPLKKRYFLLFGILPLVPISLIFTDLLYGDHLLPWWFWLILFFFALVGFILVAFYRASFKFKSSFPRFYLVTGTGGVKSLLLAYLLLFIGTGYLISPEKWAFVQGNIFQAITWNSIVKYLEFVTFSFSLGGLALLFLLEGKRWENGRQDPEYQNFVSTLGKICAVGFSLLLAPLIVLELVTIPPVSRSLAVFINSGVALCLSALFCLLVLRVGKEGGMGRPAPGVLFLVIAVMIGGAHLERNMAIKERTEAHAARIAVEQSKQAKAPEERGGKKGEEELTRGKSVYEKVCSNCHRFDQKLIGPPFQVVIDKYRGRREDLENFVRNPVKVSPDYPAMPKLPLSEAEIQAVARFLLENDKGKR